MEYFSDIELVNGARILKDGNELLSENGLFIPSLASAPSSPTQSQMYWNTTDKILYVYNGTAWEGLNAWIPPKLNLNGQNQGTQAFNAAAGHLRTFGANQDDAIRWNVELAHGSIPYDGSNIIFSKRWQLYTAPAAGNTVRWELDYAFVNDGDDQLSLIDGTIVNNLTVDARTARQQYTDSFTAISGAAGSTHLQLTLRRNGTGTSSDTYGGDADLYNVRLSKG